MFPGRRLRAVAMVLLLMASRGQATTVCCQQCDCFSQGTVVCRGALSTMPNDCDANTYVLDLTMARFFQPLSNTSFQGLSQVRELRMPALLDMSANVLEPLEQLQRLFMASTPDVMPSFTAAMHLRTLIISVDRSSTVGASLMPQSLQSPHLTSMSVAHQDKGLLCRPGLLTKTHSLCLCDLLVCLFSRPSLACCRLYMCPCFAAR